MSSNSLMVGSLAGPSVINAYSRVLFHAQQNAESRDLFFHCGDYLRGNPRRIVVLKTLAEPTFGVAALAATTLFGASASHAAGNAPWCAVINIGTGTVYWDCQYPTFEACYHLGNILAGNRGFCNLNPWPGPSQVVRYRQPKRHAQY